MIFFGWYWICVFEGYKLILIVCFLLCDYLGKCLIMLLIVLIVGNKLLSMVLKEVW